MKLFMILCLANVFSFIYSNPLSDKVCMKTGLTCSLDCQEIILCLADNDHQDTNGNITFKKFFIEKCSFGSLCDPSTGLCSNNLNGCPFMKNYCTGVGVFPDPNSGNKYHMCTHENAVPIIHSCPPGYNYSASGACLQKVYSPVPKCTPTQVHTALEDNPSLYLVCENQMYPRIYRCPTGIYNTLLGMCIDPTELNQYEVDFECKTPGQYPTFDLDCYEYIQCTDKLVPIRSRCMSGYRFDQMLNQCVKESDSMFPCNGPEDIADFKAFRIKK